MSKLTLFAKRVIFISAIMVVAIGSFIYMNAKYDPLSRYPYELTEAQHERIVKGLTNNEINYIIEYSINPDDFLPFVGCTGYNIYRLEDYKRTLTYYSDLPPQQVVDFYNAVMSNYKKDVTLDFRGYYLTEIIDYHRDYPKGNQLALVADDITLIVNRKNSVGYYTPKDLVSVSLNSAEANVTLRKDAAEAFESMMISLKSAVKKKQFEKLKIAQSFTSYQLLGEQGIQCGVNDYQLGLSVNFVFDDGTDFKDSDIQNWLNNNAHMFGFVKYSDKESGHYRYVGINRAYEVNSKNVAYEDFK